MPNPVVFFEVIGSDAEPLADFYRSLFDWPTQEAGEGYTMVAPEGEQGLRGGIGQHPPGGEGHATFYVQVDDLQATLDRAEQLGGATVMPPTRVMDMVDIALVRDPQGQVVGLVLPPSNQRG